ncbi:MAG: fructosamine kinase family protein [bacterium]
MADKPIHPVIKLSEEDAARILSSWLDRDVAVSAVRRLTGGCVNTVVRVDYDDGEVVLKLSHQVEDAKLNHECDVLRHFEQVPAFRVPRVLHRDISGGVVPHSFFIMEYLAGVNLGDAAAVLDVGNRILIEREIGEAVVRLHEVKRERFGSCVNGTEFERWSDCFLERFHKTIREISDGQLLDADVLRQIDRIQQPFSHLLNTNALPTLTHGDIWSTNIILSPAGGMWALAGFVDPGGLYAHPEFELAYLDIWSTVGKTFHEVYRHYHTVEHGYEVRRLFYWLHTLLIHVRAFKTDYYRSAAVSLINQMIQMIPT